MVDRVGIIGGGAVGLQTAVELATRGVTVTVFEKGTLGSGATGRAAGICYDAYAGRRDARIAAGSLEVFRESGLLTERPYVWFAREDDEVAAAIESQAARMEEIGRDVRLIDPAELRERFPALSVSDMTTAAIAENAGYVETEEYVEFLEKRATSESVSIRTETAANVTPDGAIRGESERFEFETVLVAAGASTPEVLAKTDVELALGRYRTQALVAGPMNSSIPMFYDASTEKYARPTGNGVLAGNGSHLYDGAPEEYSRDADEPFVTERMDALDSRLTAELSVNESWAGLCTATPDRNPLLGSVRPELYVGTGFCGHGFMRSPAVGSAIAADILGDGGIDAFDPTRFTGDESISLPIGVTDRSYSP